MGWLDSDQILQSHSNGFAEFSLTLQYISPSLVLPGLE